MGSDHGFLGKTHDSNEEKDGRKKWSEDRNKNEDRCMVHVGR